VRVAVAVRLVCEFRGERFVIEKRRAEPGCPAGWYYFGPGNPSGVHCGDQPEHAAEIAMEALSQFFPPEGVR
jgi:hypothetical protein